jgi:hypothetical protein
MNYFGRLFFNFIGASLRWFVGKIFSNNEFTFSEYLNGPENSNDFYDEMGHQFNNRMIGAIFFFLFILVIQYIF